MLASALLLGVSIASLNLCTDEYLLLLARPGEVASVSYLSHDSLESPLSRLARGIPSNRGSIEDVLVQRPDVVLTMGGGGRATALLAHRLNIRAVEVSPTVSVTDVARNMQRVAAALGDQRRAAPWVDWLRRLRRTSPTAARDAIWLGGGGQSLAAGSVGAEWLRLAGLRQRPLSGARLSLEELIVRPPAVLVRSNYRSGQISSNARWLNHPLVRAAKSHQLPTDGRAWTCMGPLMIAEIERLRAAMQ